MRILFKNTTKYTKENCDNFDEFHNNKFGKRDLTKEIIYCILVLYVSIFNLIYKNWLFVYCGVVLGGLLFFLEKNKRKAEEKKKNKVKEFTFCFYKKHMKAKYKKEYVRFRYFQFHKIYETEEYFYLYLDENSSMILSKDGFEIGTAKQFSKFIKNKCPFKYKDEKKTQNRYKYKNKNRDEKQ